MPGLLVPDLVHLTTISRKIYFLRRRRVMLDSDLAELYGVPTKSLNLAVRRNRRRFPSDFMFQANTAEIRILRFQIETSSGDQDVFPILRSQIATSKYDSSKNLRRQIGTSRSKYGGRRYRPYVFTQEGVAMLSGVLRSERAVQVNIAIMRAFVRLRELLSSHKELAAKLEVMERKYDKRFKIVFEAIRRLMKEPDQEHGPALGFEPNK